MQPVGFAHICPYLPVEPSVLARFDPYLSSNLINTCVRVVPGVIALANSFSSAHVRGHGARLPPQNWLSLTPAVGITSLALTLLWH